MPTKPAATEAAAEAPAASVLTPEAADRIDKAWKSQLSMEQADTVQNLAKRLEEEVPAVVKRGETFALRRPERRLTWGITRQEGRFTMALLVEKEESWAFGKANELKREQGAHVAVTTVGLAHSAVPEPLPQKPEKRLRPGLSISHFGGWAGTLGCLVEVGNGEPGAVSASHVLGMNNKAKTGDLVLHPGNPDGGPPLKLYQFGQLADFVLLAHHSSEDLDFLVNTLDVALVDQISSSRMPSANWVPNPTDPTRRISIKRLLPAEQLFEHIGETVYKIGRTTGFTAGILEYTNIQRYPIRLMDRKAYLYSDIAAVANIDRKAFSQPGDSGALVYTGDGEAIGLIVGGSDSYTFLSPLAPCLKAVKARLLGVNN